MEPSRMPLIRSANITGPVSRKAGGLFESVRRLVQSLDYSGMDVRVFGLADEFCAADVVAWKPITVSTLKTFGFRHFGFAPGMLSEVRAYAPEITHTHGIWLYSSMVTTRYARSSHTPYLISPHGMLDPWAVDNSKWKKRVAAVLYENKHLRGAACIRALCQSEAQSIRAYGLRNPICIIPNGIDLPDSKTNLQSPFFNSRGMDGRKVLLYLGRLHPKKNLGPLLSAWAKVHRDSKAAHNWVLAIAGWDQDGYEMKLGEQCKELGLTAVDIRQSTLDSRHSVAFLGPQFGDAKAGMYARCDAFVLPSLSEGLPMVVLEAWAYGKPVLMTDECNLPEGFASKAALRIGTSADCVAHGIRLLTEMSEEERLAMGRRGVALARDRFVWPRIAADMRAVYEWILGRGQKPSCVVME
jgi:glycosyltransferase involved in cell wall biosynthesis